MSNQAQIGRQMQTSRSRPGRLSCLCDGIEAPEDDSGRRTANIFLLAAGFAFSVLSQIITLGMLPLIGGLYAPSSGLVTLPFASFFVGAMVASFPASFLLDGFGRRAAFGLGASLGIAGGLVLAWGLMHAQFQAVVLGAFWLGIANGFGLFYRHAAAGLGMSGRRNAVSILFGAGAVVGLVAPTLAVYAEQWSPSVFVGSAILAALAHVGALALAIALPGRRVIAAVRQANMAWSGLLIPTIVGATSWFLMTALMGATPIAMIGCGINGTEVTGAIGWHVLAMYMPALLVPRLPQNISAWKIAFVGLSCLILAVVLFMIGQTTLVFSSSLIFLGFGWSLSIVAATLLLYDAGTPSSLQLAIHDALLLAGAIAGAIAAGWIAL
ncbi:MFS transporter [Microvirga sp. W0021]|uniref:MFS transporter n=1 Tax=Hohaiivirga grylli TaxID=3133970 RepID=A0ABV0BM45_9HYPH